jgi:hypothetical protein
MEGGARSRAPRSRRRTAFALLRSVLATLEASASPDDVPYPGAAEDPLGHGEASRRQIRSCSVSAPRTAPPPQGGALRAKPRSFPLPGAEVQQQRRKWFLPDLRGVNQRLEHGA